MHMCYNKSRHFRKGIVTGLLSLCVAASFLAGCSKKQEEAPTDEVPNVKIGVILDFSGERKEQSEQLYMAMQMAVDEINEAGGVLVSHNMLELVKKDDEGVALNAAGAYYQLAEERVAACIGSNTPEAMDTLINITYGNVPLITPTVSSNNIVSAIDFNFQSCFSDAYIMKANAYFVENELNSKYTAVLVEAGDEYLLSCYQDYMTALLNQGAAIAFVGEIEFSEDRLLDAFSEINSKGIDSVMIISQNEESIGKVFSVAESCEYEGSFLGTEACRDYSSDTKGYDLYLPCDASIDNPFSGVAEFFDRFETKYGIAAEETARNILSAYEAVYYVKGAIELAYTANPANVVLKLPFLEGEGCTGDYKIIGDGSIERPVDFVKINNGEESFAGSIWR